MVQKQLTERINEMPHSKNGKELKKQEKSEFLLLASFVKYEMISLKKVAYGLSHLYSYAVKRIAIISCFCNKY